MMHYVTSKAAVVGFSRVLARELGPDNIRVNTLAPGATMSEEKATRRGAEELRALGIDEDSQTNRAAGRPGWDGSLSIVGFKHVCDRANDTGERRGGASLRASRLDRQQQSEERYMFRKSGIAS